MNAKELNRTFMLIVNTLLKQDTKPQVVQAHIQQYAKDAGISYALARQAVVLKIQAIVTERIAQI